MPRLPRFLLILPSLLLSGCAHQLFDSRLVEPPKVSDDTQSAKTLKKLPPAQLKTVVSVYDFQDQTGQLKPNTQFAEYSKAVTQGGLSMLNKALMEAGDGTWFTVVERGGLKDLVQERQIVQVMRSQYGGPNGEKLESLPPMLYSGIVIEGGVVGYDSNVVTGGAGANYLGIGGNIDYRRDIATVDLRAVNVATGEILLSVTAEKTIYSTGVTGSVFKYVAFDKLLQLESGVTANEPPQLAVRKAIETAVYSIVMEGARKGYWQFADPQAGHAALVAYAKSVGEPLTSPANTPDAAQPNLQQPSTVAKPAQPDNNLTKSIYDSLKDIVPGKSDDATPKQSPEGYPIAPVPQKTPR